MLSPHSTWGEFLAITLVAAVVLLAPGYTMLWSLRAPRRLVLPLAPLTTSTAIAIGGITFTKVGIPWTPPTALGWLGALLLGCFLLGRLTPIRRIPRSASDPVWLHTLAATGFVAAVLAVCYLLAARLAGNIPQSPDIVYHLGLVRWFVDHQSISSFNTRLGDWNTVAFYPAALHGVAATVAMVTNAHPVLALSAVELLFMSVAWPLGLMALVRSVMPVGRRMIWLTALASLSFPVFPYRLLTYGPLWPLNAAYVTVPGWLALLAWSISPLGRRQPIRWVGVALCLALLPGIGLLHVTGVLTALFAAWLMTLERSFARRGGATTRARWTLRAAILLVGIAAITLAWRFAPDGMTGQWHQKGEGLLDALGGALTLWAYDQPFLAMPASVIVLVLSVIGAVTLCLHRRWALVVTAAGLWVTSTLLHAFGTDIAWAMTWPFYNMYERMRPTVPLFAAVLLVAGLRWVFLEAHQRWGRRTSVIVGTTVALVLAGSSAACGEIGWRWMYGPKPEVRWLSPDDADALRSFARLLPPDAVVVANPWKGGEFLPLVSPLAVLIPTEKSTSPDIDLLAHHLDEASSRPDVCAALARGGARFLITGGNIPDPWIVQDPYPAFERAAKAPGFKKIAQQGDYTLFEITACR